MAGSAVPIPPLSLPLLAIGPAAADLAAALTAPAPPLPPAYFYASFPCFYLPSKVVMLQHGHHIITEGSMSGHGHTVIVIVIIIAIASASVVIVVAAAAAAVVVVVLWPSSHPKT